ncbi:MAG: hypothetical protein HY293_08165 [Planctomycetes bacterium]|nr:hypothetical protein [Planctomycetota bacterium]
MYRALSLLLLTALQDEAPTFGKDQRLTAAIYHSASGTRHAAEFLEMGKAGIEIALVPFEGKAESLDPLVAALEGLEKEGRRTPRLAALVQPGAVPDLSAADAFYARVPGKHAARIDGRPVVWLAPAPPGSTLEKAAMAAAASRLKTSPYLVTEISWENAPADRTYASGALRGFGADVPVVSVTPGGGNRDEGKVYERLWYKAIKLESRLVLIESWNGAADGVSETPERKRKYLDLTQRLVRDFKVNEKPVLQKTKWAAETKVAYTAVYTPHEQGLRPVAVEDGLVEEIRLRGFEALGTRENRKGTLRRMCFDVDDSFCYFEKRSFEVAVEYLDLGEGSFSLEYDSADRTIPPDQRALKSAGVVKFAGSGEWRTQTFSLPDAMFGNGQPGGSDFRFSVDKRGLSIRAVLVSKK